MPKFLQKHLPVTIGLVILFLILYIKPHNSIKRVLNLWNNEPVASICGYVQSYEYPNILCLSATQNISVNDIVLVSKYDFYDSKNVAYAVIIQTYQQNNSIFARALLLEEYKLDFGYNFIFSISETDFQLPHSKVIENRENIIGFIGNNSDINKIYINLYNDNFKISNYDIVEVETNNRLILYQIVNAIVNQDNVQRDKCGFKTAVAIQVGAWNKEHDCFDDYKWVPALNTVVYKTKKYTEPIKELEKTHVIGKFNTDHPIYINVHDLVTHNCAILGVTGSGKSFLGYTIIEGIINQGIKVICIDNTGDYFKRVNSDEKVHIQSTENIVEFLKSKSMFGIATATQVKSVLSIFEKVYSWAKEFYDPTAQEIIPRICIFMEEAHSLIPEWNSVVDKNDSTYVNMISKYVMQGRKYGCGVVVVTQRTANVTKSILSQCNTIFSFKAFDKTSNDFLSSFMNDEYLSTISRLDTGQAIITGKALTSGRPIVMNTLYRERQEALKEAAVTKD